MKIAILNIYQKTATRGAETYIRELAYELSKRNEVEVFSGDWASEERWPVLWRLFLDPKSASIALFTLKLLPTLLKNRFDIVMPTNGGWQPAFVRIATWIYGGKMVIPGFSGVGWDDRNNLWNFPDAYVAISKRAKEWAEKINPFVKSYYIPGGVNTAKFKPGGATYKHNLQAPVFLHISALTPEKRVHLAIEAVGKLKKGSLFLEGSGPLRLEVERLGRRLLGKRFKLIKSHYRELPKIYRSADIFTIPTDPSNSFGLVLLEAMACGLPVVANDDPIRREIVGDAGLLVDPRDTDAYARALEKAIKIDWGDKPRKQAEKFSWEVIAKEYEKLFTNLVR